VARREPEAFTIGCQYPASLGVALQAMMLIGQLPRSSPERRHALERRAALVEGGGRAVRVGP